MESALAAIPVPLVALELDEYHQPSGFLNVTSVSFVQPKNVPSPMLATPFPIVTLVRPVQFSNAEEPMLITLSGIVTLVRHLHLLNAPATMQTVPSLIS